MAEHRYCIYSMESLIFFDEQVQRVQHPGPGVNALPTPVTALAFDTQQDLLWAGNQYVSVAVGPT
jgi:hypothetical protein